MKSKQHGALNRMNLTSLPWLFKISGAIQAVHLAIPGATADKHR